jgi:hypothetical protein
MLFSLSIYRVAVATAVAGAALAANLQKQVEC